MKMYSEILIGIIWFWWCPRRNFENAVMKLQVLYKKRIS
jgi:hypothetical protein